MNKEEKTPEFIKQLPWYAQDSQGRGQLAKISAFEPRGFLEEWYNRGEKGFQSTTYRKGACENCGAMGHNRKQCTERPRKMGAKFSNKQIASDDIVKDLRMNWQVKRDRWNGYTPEMYSQVIEDYSKYEQVRKKIKGEDIDDEYKVQEDPVDAANIASKNKLKEKFQGLGGVRNREDRAKYLNNLDPGAASFDPKSRILIGEDDFLKQLNNLEAVGEKASLEEQNRFAFEQVDKHHAELSSMALPTLTERIFKNVREKQAGLTSGKMGEIMKKYGVQSSGQLIEVVQQQFEGETIARAKRVVRSKYEEDVFINDHTAVWGSWYNKYLGWGYGCCYSNEKTSYCAGIKGRERALAKELKLKTQQLKDLQKLKELERAVEKGEEQDRNQYSPQQDNEKKQRDANQEQRT